jgi:hypothetical protein
VHAPVVARMVGSMMLVYPFAEQYDTSMLVAVLMSCKSEHSCWTIDERLCSASPSVSGRHRQAFVLHPT